MYYSKRDREAHLKLMAKLSSMSSKEIFQTSVDAGIHNPDGSLTEPYRKPTTYTGPRCYIGIEFESPRGETNQTSSEG